MEKINQTLRNRLLVLLTAFVVPTPAAAAMAIYYIGEQKQRQFELGLRETTHLYASQIAPTPDRVVVLAELNGQQFVNTRLPFGSQLPKSSQRRANPADANAAVFSDIYHGSLSSTTAQNWPSQCAGRPASRQRAG